MGTGGGGVTRLLKREKYTAAMRENAEIMEVICGGEPLIPSWGRGAPGGGVRGYPWLLLDLVMASG